ncbi:MAG TPA: hypothetical protein VIP29_02925 [Nitrososphaeraceae archaeon]
MNQARILGKIKELQKVCKIVSKLKSQLIEELPHYGHNAPFLKNDEITTGLLNNMSEIKINLLTGQLLYFHDEQGYLVELTHDDFVERLEEIVTKYGLEMPQTAPLTRLRCEDLFQYLAFATKANKSLELFRMKLSDRFTQVHLWPDGFDFSVESFMMKNNEQIGVGISPGDNAYGSPCLYVNPYPFNEKIAEQSLCIGKWHTSGWKGIKVEWKELEDKIDQEISSKIYNLFLVAKRNFQ